ncbi:MAG: hypothetical protein A2284_17365 [Deltaproteobacteria bacterium RIFOXYA12_FULL_61_11]|nr:MAG: hypothetical protein A2284_17365 [Deltaproteobacteria bacterium RIFOXYA12_FULL_61_11]
MLSRILFIVLTFALLLGPAVQAATGTFNDFLTPKAKELNEELRKVTTPAQVAEFLAKLEAMPDKGSEVLFYKAMLLPLKDFRYVIWRGRDLVSTSLTLHARSLQILISLRKQLRDRYGDTAKAFYDYFTEIPATKEIAKAVGQFTSVGHVQDTLLALAAPEGPLGKALARLELLARNPEFKLTIDRTVFLGMDFYLNQFSKRNAMRFVDHDDVIGLMGRLQRRIGQIYTLAMYDLDGIGPYTNEMMRLTAMENVFKNSFKPSDIHTVVINSPFLRTKALRGNKVDANFLTLRPEGKEYSAKAISYFQQAITNGRAWYLASLDRPKEGSDYLYHAEFLYNREKDKREAIDQVFDLYNGDQPCSILENPNTGKTVRVCVRQFFENPPQDLKRLFANKFYENQHRKNAVDHLHDYDYGHPTAFPDPTFRGLLPEANPQNVTDLIGVLRGIPAAAVLSRLFFITG